MLCQKLENKTITARNYELKTKQKTKHKNTKKHKSQADLLIDVLGESLYESLKPKLNRSINMFPLEVSENSDGTAETRRITFEAPDETTIIAQIKNTHTGPMLLLFDDIQYRNHHLRKFLSKLRLLIRSIDQARLLLVCSQKLHKLMRNIQQNSSFRNCEFEHRSMRLEPISKDEACRLMRVKFSFIYYYLLI